MFLRVSKVTSLSRYIGLLKKEEERRRMPNRDFLLRADRCVRNIALYSDVIHSFDWKSAVEHDVAV